MKASTTRLLTITLALLFVGSAFAGSRDRSNKNDRDNISWRNDNSDCTRIDMKHGSVIIEHEYRREISTVEITEDFELFIDDELIKTDDAQNKLLEEYHVQLIEIHDQAKRIGWEGAKIGAQGAKIGLLAGIGVLKMLFTDYSEDDLEYDVEFAAEKLEERAERLEDKAEGIERMVDDLDDITDDLRDSIPELSELDWF